MGTIARTRTTAEVIDRLKYTQGGLRTANPYLMFAQYELREVREACLKEMGTWLVRLDWADQIEDIARALLTEGDPLRHEFLRAYLFCHGEPGVTPRAIRFYLEQCPESAATQRSKDIFGVLRIPWGNDRGQRYRAAYLFVEGELCFFRNHILDRRYYGDDEWYRVERAAKLGLEFEDYTIIPTLQSILKAMRRLGKHAVRTSMTTTPEFMQSIIRAQHIAFLQTVLQQLRRVCKRIERQVQTQAQ